MSVVNDLHSVMGWLRDTVCPLVSLKRAPDIGEQGEEAYAFETVHPEVYGMYWPVGNVARQPDLRTPHPGILVQLSEGSEGWSDMRRRYRLRLHLSAWNPGQHGPDVWYPKESPGPLEPRYVRGPEGTYEDGYGGWQDAWSFLDTMLRELRNARDVGGLSIDRSEPLAFGPYSEQGAIIDVYPYWFCWVDLALVAQASPPTWAEDYL